MSDKKTARLIAAARPGEVHVIVVADTSLTLAWKRPACAELALQLRPAYRGGAWADVARVALGAAADQHETTGLACQETYEARLVWRVADSPQWVEGPVAAFDTLPAGCGPKKRAGCAVA